MSIDGTIRVAELFAGVGGFRLGLEGWHGCSATSGYSKPFLTPYRVVWSNQWEPSTKTQHASTIYEHRWGGNNHCNQDIAAVSMDNIPDHDLLVGGFPCQDYSVASTLRNAKGLIGKKGVLWWAIHRIVSEKNPKPKYLLLENVDRLLISPSEQRGRDFAIILQSLNEQGYAVEWRVINAADYGMPQRRRRIFIVAYLAGTKAYQMAADCNPANWVLREGGLAGAFPVNLSSLNRSKQFSLEGSIVDISSNFNKESSKGIFENSGLMVSGLVTTIKTEPSYLGAYRSLNSILQNGEVPQQYFIDNDSLERWQYLKGAKSEIRRNSMGFEYSYAEGRLPFPDPLDRPSRTIITGEGGTAPSRFKHVVETPKGLRRLTPIELERLNMFPDNHTLAAGITDSKRAFLMGNALVVGVVERIGVEMYSRLLG